MRCTKWYISLRSDIEVGNNYLHVGGRSWHRADFLDERFTDRRVQLSLEITDLVSQVVDLEVLIIYICRTVTFVSFSNLDIKIISEANVVCDTVES